ncbi:MAG: hypothetical protein AAGD13_00775 [Pseudomonadota bacterium]
MANQALSLVMASETRAEVRNAVGLVVVLLISDASDVWRIYYANGLDLVTPDEFADCRSAFEWAALRVAPAPLPAHIEWINPVAQIDIPSPADVDGYVPFCQSSMSSA